METRLTIRWDGPSPSLRNHRLSLGDWAKPLGILLRAVRRTASGIARARQEEDGYGAKGGRLSRVARSIDLELASLSDGCVRANFVVTSSEQQTGIDGIDMRSQALLRLLSDVEREASGERCNPSARKYLLSLPPDVSEHTYELTADGTLLKTANVSTTSMKETGNFMAGLITVEGSVNAVVFDPPQVTIRSDDTKVKGAASRQLVERCLELRDTRVQAVFAVYAGGRKTRLVSLAGLGAESAPLGPEARVERMLSDWPDTLRRLAQ